MRVNAAEGLGGEWAGRAGALERYRARYEGARPVWLDGRMLPHEWLRTPAGYVKTDGVGHGDDHFFPGPQNTAWDVAAFSLEFRLDEPTTRAFAGAVSARTGDAGLAGRLPFFVAAYAAFRLGYASLAAGTLAGTPDGDGFTREARRSAARLRAELGRGAGEPARPAEVTP